MSTAQHPAQDLDWLVTDFTERVRHVAHAVVVSADGFALAFSARLPHGRADQLAAVTSGLVGLADGAARTFQAGEVIQTAVEMEAGLLVIMPAGKSSTLAVLAAAECDLGLVSREMRLLAERARRELTPATRGLPLHQHPDFRAGVVVGVDGGEAPGGLLEVRHRRLTLAGRVQQVGQVRVQRRHPVLVAELERFRRQRQRFYAVSHFRQQPGEVV